MLKPDFAFFRIQSVFFCVAKEIGFDRNSYKYGTIDVLKGMADPMDALLSYGKYSVRVLPGGKPVCMARRRGGRRGMPAA